MTIASVVCTDASDCGAAMVVIGQAIRANELVIKRLSAIPIALVYDVPEPARGIATRDVTAGIDGLAAALGSLTQAVEDRMQRPSSVNGAGAALGARTATAAEAIRRMLAAVERFAALAERQSQGGRCHG